MNNLFNSLEDFPILPEIFNSFSEFESNPSNEIEPPIFSPPIDLNSLDLCLPKKNLFITKKNKTSFITFKRKESNPVKKSKPNLSSLSKGRWTRKERLKFAYALFKFGTDWNKIKNYISTRSMIQLRSHAQKFLEKLKNDKFIVQKGLDFNNYNWRQSFEYLKENLSEDELLNVLYSIESELGDNNRMTEKYLERKRLKTKSTFEESLNTALSSFDESHSHINFSGNKLNEEKLDNGNQSYNFPDIINLEEENNQKDDLLQNYFDQNYNSVYNIFKKDLFSMDENSFDSEQDSGEFKTKLNSFEHLFKL